ncbi:MAG TPA: hypothetical protein VIS96_06175 [Terrimicrobiaceae bacterium]
MSAEEVAAISDTPGENAPEAATVAREANASNPLAEGSVHESGVESDPEVRGADPSLPADPPLQFELRRGK